MRWLCLALIPIALVISTPLTALMIRLGHRMRTFDSAGVPGQDKAPRRMIPNTGGVAVFWAIALPIAIGLAFTQLFASPQDWPAALQGWLAPLKAYLPGIRQQTPLAAVVLGSAALLHVLGLIDDRRPMGPWVKLAVMAVPPLAIVMLFPETRLLTLLDANAGGPWLSMAITVLWFLVVTNALNFMDNMDGLSAGVAAIASGCFLGAAILNGQWFVSACLALVVGACIGFLVFNFRPRGGAKIFMGDGGSLVLGFLLAFLTVRTTYYGGGGGETGVAGSGLAGGWYGVFMPVVVLAVPIYDFVSVCSIRISQGRSPFVGDRQHLSHRLVKLGLSPARAVLVIYGLTAITGMSGVVLGSLKPWQAVIVGIQAIVILLVIAAFEYSRARPRSGGGEHGG